MFGNKTVPDRFISLQQWIRHTLVVTLAITLCWMGSPAQAASIPPQLDKLEAQIAELQVLVRDRNWPEIRFYVNGPMGYTRKDLSAVAQSLPTSQRKQARDLGRKLTDYMIDVDQGSRRSDKEDVDAAQRALKQTFQELKDLVSRA